VSEFSLSESYVPRGLSYLFHANSTDFSQLVRLNFESFWTKTFAERIAKSKLWSLDLAVR